MEFIVISSKFLYLFINYLFFHKNEISQLKVTFFLNFCKFVNFCKFFQDAHNLIDIFTFLHK